MGTGPAGKPKGSYFSVDQFLGLACCTNANTCTRKPAGRSGRGERGCHLSAAAWIGTRLKCPGDDSLICSSFLMEDVGNAKMDQSSRAVAEGC